MHSSSRRTALIVRQLCCLTALIALAAVAPAGPARAETKNGFPSVTLWPLVYHAQNAEQVRTDVLYPVFHYKRDGSRSRFAIRPFLYNLEENPEEDAHLLEILWPFSKFKRQGADYDRYVFPFYFSSADDRQTTFHIWPFYRHQLESAGTESWASVYPFFQYRQNETRGLRQIDYLWPLGRSRSTPDTSLNYLLPFWWRERTPDTSGGFVFPYFWYQGTDTRRNAVFPLWYRGRSANEQTDLLVPFWYAHTSAERRFRTLFPLYWHSATTGEREWSLILPLYGDYQSAENEYRLLFPFYFRHTSPPLDSELRYFFPLYGDYRRGPEVRHRYYLFPLYAHIRDSAAEREAWYFLWPLVYLDRAPGHSETWVVPFYWGRENPDRRFRAALLPPFYAYEDREGRQRWHLWPFYGLEQDAAYVERSVAWPLFRWGRSPDGERRAWQFLLAYRRVGPQRDMVGFFPVWHSDRKADRIRNVSLLHWQEADASGRQFSLLHLGNPDWSLFTTRREPQRRHHHLFPFYSFTRDEAEPRTKVSVIWPLYRYHSAGDGSTSHQLLWKLLYAESSPAGDERGFLWRLVRSKQDESGKLFEFNPFYYAEERSNGDRYTSWLGGLYATRREASGTRRTLFWLIDF